jgi:tetratricopeptide (TPR) repeat protein
MWDSDSLHRIQADAKSWFAPLGLETPLELYQRLYEVPLHPIHMSAFEELVTDPEIAIIEDAYVSNVLLEEKLDIESFALGMKAIARIAKELRISRSGCESGSFFFQLESNDGLNIVHELSIYLINGKKTLFWTNRVLVNSQNPGLFFEFRKSANDGSITTFSLKEETTPSFGTCTSFIHVPLLLTALFFRGESEGDDIRNTRPQEVRPVIFNLWDESSVNPKFLNNPEQNESQISRFTITTHAGYRLTELTDSALDFLIAQAPNVLSSIQANLVDGYRDKKTSRFFHQILGSESGMPDGGEATSPLAVGRWIPAVIAEQNAAWSWERYKEAWGADKQDAWSMYLEILQEGCGWIIPHTINTLIYGFLIPQARFSEGVELGLRGMYLPESDQTKNAQNNTAICYLRMGDTDSAKELFTDSAENPYHSQGVYSRSVEEEAKYFLGEIAESEGNVELAVEYYISVVRIAGDSYVLPAKLALDRLGVEAVGEVSERSEVMEFRNDDLRYPYMDYLSGDEEKIATIEDEDPDLFQMFEELNSYEFLTLWGDWSMDFEHPFSDEAWEKVSYQLGFLIDNLEDELSEEQLEQFVGYPKRLSVRDDFLPTSESGEYKFNVEGGDCSISAKAPQLPPDNDDQDYDDRTSLKGHTGIDCDKHENSKECYLHKCDANLITLPSGFGDGVYGVTCFDNWHGEVECVIAYFYHDHEYVENFIIENDFEAPGFIEGFIPFYLGRLSSNGEFFFGDTASWTEGRDEESWSLARVEVPADEYLVLGWIDPRTSFDRVFFVGLYRNVMKSYLEKVMDFYPATKTFADDYIIFEHGIADY